MTTMMTNRRARWSGPCCARRARAARTESDADGGAFASMAARGLRRRRGRLGISCGRLLERDHGVLAGAPARDDLVAERAARASRRAEAGSSPAARPRRSPRGRAAWPRRTRSASSRSGGERLADHRRSRPRVGQPCAEARGPSPPAPARAGCRGPRRSCTSGAQPQAPRARSPRRTRRPARRSARRARARGSCSRPCP